MRLFIILPFSKQQVTFKTEEMHSTSTHHGQRLPYQQSARRWVGMPCQLPTAAWRLLARPLVREPGGADVLLLQAGAAFSRIIMI